MSPGVPGAMGAEQFDRRISNIFIKRVHVMLVSSLFIPINPQIYRSTLKEAIQKLRIGQREV